MKSVQILILATVALLGGCPKPSSSAEKVAEEVPLVLPWPKTLTRLHRSIDGDYGVVCYSLVRPGHAGSVECLKVTVDPAPERPQPNLQMNPW